MRIALITPGFSASADDWCIPVLRNLAAGLNADHEVEIFTAAYPPFASEYPVAGVPVKSFGSGAKGRIARYREMRQLAATLRASHGCRPFDVLHGFWAHEGGLLCSLLGRRLAVPSLMTIMAGELTYEASVGYGKRHRFAGFLGRYAARRVAAVSAISEYQRDRLAREEPWLDTACLPFGVDTALFTEHGEAKDYPNAINVLIVGSLVPVKGHATALHAIDQVAKTNPDVHLHVVGEGSLHEALRDMVNNIGIQSRVTFHGHVEHDLLPLHYRAADFCLLCSHFETSGLVILEAAACGRITVGSDVGSLAEITPTEYRTAPGDVQELVNSIERLIEAPVERQRLERQALERVHAEFTLEHMVRRYTNMYERLNDLARAGN